MIKDDDHGVRAHSVARRHALRVVGTVEAAKGLAVLAAVAGLIDLVHQDAISSTTELIERLGMGLGIRRLTILLRYADILKNTDLCWLLFLAIAYVALRFIEAYGLWENLIWAEWLGALSGAIYIPFEIYDLLRQPSPPAGLVLIGNVIVVSFLAFQLWRRRGETMDASADSNSA
jgi:uncharacterized membrane protein (DUF2068 family)